MKYPEIRFTDIIFAIIIFFLGLVSFVSYRHITSLKEAQDLVTHTNLVKATLQEALLNSVDAETAQRGFLLTRDSTYLEPMKGGAKTTLQTLTQIDSLTDDNPRQLENSQQLRSYVLKRYERLYFILSMAKDRNRSLIPYLQSGKDYMDSIRLQVSSMIQLEDRLMDERTRNKERSETITPLYSLLLSILAILFVVIAFLRLRFQTIMRHKAQDNEAKFRLLADSIPQLIWTGDVNGNLNYFNKAVFDYSGLNTEQLQKEGWIGLVHPDDKNESIRRWRNSIQTGEEFLLEHRFRNNKGNYRWQLSRALPQKNNKKEIQQWVGTSTDIEDQKNFVSKLEQLVNERTAQLTDLNTQLLVQNMIFAHAEETAMIGSYSMDLTTMELQYSDNFFRMLGHEPGDFTPTFEKFLSFIHPDDKEQVIQDGKETFETRKLVQHVYRIIKADSTIRYFRSSGNFIGEDNGQKMVGTVQDITEDVLLQADIENKNAELERSNAELASFNYVASHDLQEPLRKIQLFSRMILEKEEQVFSEDTNHYFSRITAAANRMQNLIEALLSYSRSTASGFSFVATDLNSLLKEVIEELDDTIAEKKAVIDIDPLPILMVVPLQFHQLFINLISNAFKYSREGVPPFIKITAVIVPKEEIRSDSPLTYNRYHKITVTDNGIGFEQQYENKVFDLFQRLHGKSEYSGTGIGLAICRKIMQNHHGLISVKSEPGKGAAFSIYAPVDNNP